MEEVSRALGDPRKIALEFKAILHLNAFQKKQSLGNFGRMVFSFISVVWLNLFMLPFVATVSLLFVSLYLVSLSCLIGGTLIVASGFFNLNDIVHMESASGKIGLHVPPYTIAYYSNAEKDLSNISENTSFASADHAKAADTHEATRLAYRVSIGLIYLVVGMLLYWLSRKFGKVLLAALMRYVNLNLNLLRNARINQED